MPSPARSDQVRVDRGQATVELALCLPFICLLVLAVVQVGLVVRDRIAVQAAARDGARAAAVSSSPGTAASATARAHGLAPVEVTSTVGGGMVTVTVRYVERTDVPLIGALLPDVHVEASATMVLEPP